MKATARVERVVDHVHVDLELTFRKAAKRHLDPAHPGFLVGFHVAEPEVSA